MNERRERNRMLFPQTALWVDTLNAAGLGPCTVMFAEENGRTVRKAEA